MNKTDSEKLARIFRVLSVNARVRMLALLKSRSLCVNALARILNITPAAASQHLRILRDTDILKPKKCGYFVHYSVNEKVLKKWRQMAEQLWENEKE